MDAKQLSEHVIVPVLQHLNMYSREAEVLMLGTAMAESDLRYIKQIGGPALSLFQVEPATERDIWENFLKYRPELAEKVNMLRINGMPRTVQMTGNMFYAAAMARLVYFRRPEALPPLKADAMYEYYKEHYNTHLGASTAERGVPYFLQALSILRGSS